MALFSWRKMKKQPLIKIVKKAFLWRFTAKRILSLSLWKQNFFKNFFLSKCLELKALQTLKILSKLKIPFVREVEIPWKHPYRIQFTHVSISESTYNRKAYNDFYKIILTHKLVITINLNKKVASAIPAGLKCETRYSCCH